MSEGAKQDRGEGWKAPCIWGGTWVICSYPAWRLMDWLYLGPIYTFLLAPLVFSYQPRGLHMILGLPGIIAFGVALPLYEILQLFSPPIMLVASDGLDLILFEVIDKVRWGPRVILPVFFCLYVWGQKGGMENGVYGPLRRES